MRGSIDVITSTGKGFKTVTASDGGRFDLSGDHDVTVDSIVLGSGQGANPNSLGKDFSGSPANYTGLKFEPTGGGNNASFTVNNPNGADFNSIDTTNASGPILVRTVGDLRVSDAIDLGANTTIKVGGSLDTTNLGAQLDVKNNNTFDITNNFTTNNILVGNNDKFNVGGNFNVQGGISNSGVDTTINVGGNFSLSGNLDLNEGADIDVGGDLNGMDVTVGDNSNIDIVGNSELNNLNTGVATESNFGGALLVNDTLTNEGTLTANDSTKANNVITGDGSVSTFNASLTASNPLILGEDSTTTVNALSTPSIIGSTNSTLNLNKGIDIPTTTGVGNLNTQAGETYGLPASIEAEAMDFTGVTLNITQATTLTGGVNLDGTTLNLNTNPLTIAGNGVNNVGGNLVFNVDFDGKDIGMINLAPGASAMDFTSADSVVVNFTPINGVDLATFNPGDIVADITGADIILPANLTLVDTSNSGVELRLRDNGEIIIFDDVFRLDEGDNIAQDVNMDNVTSVPGYEDGKYSEILVSDSIDGPTAVISGELSGNGYKVTIEDNATFETNVIADPVTGEVTMGDNAKWIMNQDTTIDSDIAPGVNGSTLAVQDGVTLTTNGDIDVENVELGEESTWNSPSLDDAENQITANVQNITGGNGSTLNVQDGGRLDVVNLALANPSMLDVGEGSELNVSENANTGGITTGTGSTTKFMDALAAAGPVDVGEEAVFEVGGDTDIQGITTGAQSDTDFGGALTAADKIEVGEAAAFDVAGAADAQDITTGAGSTTKFMDALAASGPLEVGEEAVFEVGGDANIQGITTGAQSDTDFGGALTSADKIDVGEAAAFDVAGAADTQDITTGTGSTTKFMDTLAAAGPVEVGEEAVFEVGGDADIQGITTGAQSDTDFGGALTAADKIEVGEAAAFDVAGAADTQDITTGVGSTTKFMDALAAAGPVEVGEEAVFEVGGDADIQGITTGTGSNALFNNNLTAADPIAIGEDSTLTVNGLLSTPSIDGGDNSTLNLNSGTDIPVITSLGNLNTTPGEAYNLTGDITAGNIDFTGTNLGIPQDTTLTGIVSLDGATVNLDTNVLTIAGGNNNIGVGATLNITDEDGSIGGINLANDGTTLDLDGVIINLTTDRDIADLNTGDVIGDITGEGIILPDNVTVIDTVNGIPLVVAPDGTITVGDLDDVGDIVTAINPINNSLTDSNDLSNDASNLLSDSDNLHNRLGQDNLPHSSVSPAVVRGFTHVHHSLVNQRMNSISGLYPPELAFNDNNYTDETTSTSGVNSGDSCDQMIGGLWIKSYIGSDHYKKHQVTNQAGENVDLAGHKTKNNGFVVGGDVIYGKSMVGAAVGYNRSDIKYQDGQKGSTADGTMLLGSLYGLYHFTEDVFVSVVGSYARHQYDQHSLRNKISTEAAAANNVAGVANADYKFNHYSAEARVGFRYNIGDNTDQHSVMLTPSVGVLYDHIDSVNYTETTHPNVEDSSVLAYEVKRDKIDSVHGILSLSLDARSRIHSALDLTYGAHAMVRHDFNNKAHKVTYKTISGVNSEATNIDESKDIKTIFETGVNVGVATDVYNFSLGYTYRTGSNYNAHQGSITAKVFSTLPQPSLT
ncbi:MAG TPA: autotransporter outer membrane beta-barrel domain-containing protein, partial [Candidatus Megaira endosymbiont of Hartmannula sinica]|nr:autotransporter outer membrane beta-barrel domain-containing protein [Candidatus Megaera endosymbiont of Hartmannula sinica]